MEQQKLLEELKQNLTDRGFDEDCIVPAASFREDIGLDSIDVIEMCLDFEKKYNIFIKDDEIARCLTVADFLQIVGARIPWRQQAWLNLQKTSGKQIRMLFVEQILYLSHACRLSQGENLQMYCLIKHIFQEKERNIAYCRGNHGGGHPADEYATDKVPVDAVSAF